MKYILVFFILDMIISKQKEIKSPNYPQAQTYYNTKNCSWLNG